MILILISITVCLVLMLVGGMYQKNDGLVITSITLLIIHAIIGWVVFGFTTTTSTKIEKVIPVEIIKGKYILVVSTIYNNKSESTIFRDNTIDYINENNLYWEKNYNCYGGEVSRILKFK